jgi:hypothetical protein
VCTNDLFQALETFCRGWRRSLTEIRTGKNTTRTELREDARGRQQKRGLTREVIKTKHKPFRLGKEAGDCALKFFFPKVVKLIVARKVANIKPSIRQRG